jgi:hypothetical protein
MKKAFSLIIIICAAMVPRIGQAQAQIDSSWIENRNGSFFQARKHLFPDGGEKLEVTLIGDTATTVSKFISNMRDEANRYAADAAIVRRYHARITELIRFGKALPAVLYASPYDSIRNYQEDLYSTGVWKINNTGLRFRLTGAGVFQYRPDTTATWRPAGFLDGVIRLNNLNGYTTDFFRIEGKDKWVTLNSQYAIGRFGIRSTNYIEPRSVETIETSEPALTNTTILLQSGVVQIGDKKYKWSTAKKEWTEQK